MANGEIFPSRLREGLGVGQIGSFAHAPTPGPSRKREGRYRPTPGPCRKRDGRFA